MTSPLEQSGNSVPSPSAEGDPRGEGVVFLDNFAPGQVWSTLDGRFVVRMKKRTPSGRLEVVLDDKGAGLLSNDILSDEKLRELFTARGCVLQSEGTTLSVSSSPEEGADSSRALPPDQVMSLDTEREKRASNEGDMKGEVSEIEALDQSMAEAFEAVAQVTEEIEVLFSTRETLLEHASSQEAEAAVSELSARATALIEQNNDLSMVDEVADESGIFDEAYLEGKRQRHARLQGIVLELRALQREAERMVVPSEKEGEIVTAPELPPAKPFDTLLKGRQEKISTLIEAITTPEDFAAFRRGMRLRQGKGSNETKRYFLDQRSLEEELSTQEGLKRARELKKEEQEKVYQLEDALRVILNRKFFVVKDIEVAGFLAREKGKISSAHSEADLEVIMQAWPKEGMEVPVWKDMIESLTNVEKNKINDGYAECLEALKQAAEVRKKELPLVPFYQTLDTFTGKNDRLKEKVRMFQEVMEQEYTAYSDFLYREAKKMGGKISRERRWALWQEQGGDTVIERVVVAHLERFDGIDPEEGKKVFQAIREILRQKN